jgi:hypothetical protein
MNWTGLTLASVSFVTIWSVLANSATAQCVQADVSVQYNISGSKEPTERDNQIDLQSSNYCQGNVSVTTGVQGNEGGTGKVRQSRIVRHRFENNTDSNPQLGGSTVQIKSNPAIDVYNPADRLNY